MALPNLKIGSNYEMIYKNTKILITGGSGFIGTNLIDYLIKNEFKDFLNIDIVPPRNLSHISFWSECDINNFDCTSKLFMSFKPEIVIHLAARTDLNGTCINDYKTNTIGTENIINSIMLIPSLKRVIFASSMLVNEFGINNLNLEGCFPNTEYGKSKLYSEVLITKSSIPCWTIVRPTSIWGPWFGAPYRNFFDILKRGLFFYCNDFNVNKTYGYVENTIFQIVSLLNADISLVLKKTYYLGDSSNYKILDWANEILEHTSFKVIILPSFIIKFASKCGDLLSIFKIPFPLTTFRYKNMSINNEVDLSEIQKVTGTLPVCRRDANLRTLAWMNSEYAK